MRITFVVLLVFAGATIQAQDDHPDYRNKKESFSKISEKDIRNDLASFTMGGIDESISKLPLRKIPATAYGTNFITFEGENIKVTVTTGLFDPSKHKLAMSDKYLVKIDGKGFHGNYGTTPRTNIQSVTVLIDKDTVQIPPGAYFDLYNPSFTYRDAGTMKSNSAVYFSGDKHKLYIYLLTRDDMGGYEVTWVIQDKKYLRRVLDYGFLK